MTKKFPGNNSLWSNPVLLRLGFSLVFIIVLLVLIELAAVLVAGRPTRWVQSDPRLNHTWIPDSKAEFNDYDDRGKVIGKHIHHINAQGWIEDYDIERPKPENIFRIFYVGDSFVQGAVSTEYSLPTLVENALNSIESNKNIRYEVINTGTVSYSPVLEYLLIRYVISEYEPDLIVLNIDMTDDFDDWKYRRTLELDQDKNPLACPPRSILLDEFMETSAGVRKTTLTNRIVLFLWRYSAAFNLLQKSLPLRPRFVHPPANRESRRQLHQQGIYTRWAWCQHDQDKFTELNEQFTLDMIRRIAEYCLKNNIKLVVTAVPHYQQFQTTRSGKTTWSLRPHQEIKLLSEEMGVNYIDAYSFMLSAVKGTRQNEYYHYGDMHFNRKGYTLWARAHTAALKKILNIDISPQLR